MRKIGLEKKIRRPSMNTKNTFRKLNKSIRTNNNRRKQTEPEIWFNMKTNNIINKKLWNSSKFDRRGNKMIYFWFKLDKKISNNPVISEHLWSMSMRMTSMMVITKKISMKIVLLLFMTKKWWILNQDSKSMELM